eukprot:scaffold121937_cov48-Attheya_sp.AAC.3
MIAFQEPRAKSQEPPVRQCQSTSLKKCYRRRVDLGAVLSELENGRFFRVLLRNVQRFTYKPTLPSTAASAGHQNSRQNTDSFINGLSKVHIVRSRDATKYNVECPWTAVADNVTRNVCPPPASSAGGQNRRRTPKRLR